MYLPLHLLKTVTDGGEDVPMKLRNAITQRESGRLSNYIKEHMTFNFFPEGQRRRAREYYIIPYNQDQPPAVCWSCLGHKSPWQEVSDLIRGFYATVFCVSFFPSWHCGGKTPSSPQWTCILVESPSLKAVRLCLEWLLQRRETSCAWPFCPLLSAWTWIRLHQRPKAPVFCEKTRPVDLKGPLQACTMQCYLEAHLQRQHFPVDRKEGSHGFGPGTKTSYISTYAFSSFNVVVCHFKVRVQKFYHFFIDCVFWELLRKKRVKWSQILLSMKSYSHHAHDATEIIEQPRMDEWHHILRIFQDTGGMSWKQKQSKQWQHRNQSTR